MPSPKPHLFQLAPEPSHVDGEGVVIHITVRFPQVVHECFAPDHLTLVLQKQLKDLVLITGELHFLPLIGEGSLTDVENSPPVFQEIRLADKIVSAADQRPDFGRQNRKVKRFDDKVICPHVHGQHDIEIV